MAMIKYLFAVALVAMFATEIMSECTHNGLVYQTGESYQDDCNKCVCSAGGVGGCTRKGCPPKPCTDGGNSYGAGESYLSSDGCNTCKCNANGLSMCTRKMCV